MRQFDVFQNPSEHSRRIAPYFVVLQSHYLAAMPTIIVAPLLPRAGRQPYTETSVLVTFADEGFIASIAELGAMEAVRAGPSLGDLREWEDQIRRALDRLFTWF